MRHNQNARHMRNNRRGGNNHHQRRGGNPRVQTFDSNGPDVRIRGNAFQINEKYLALARDAAAAGDRVLAESYYQHAEHYQRLLNEADEASSQRQQQHQQQQGNGYGEGPQPSIDDEPAEGPTNDLDQGFLVGDRGKANGSGAAEEGDASARRSPRGNPSRQKEAAEAV